MADFQVLFTINFECVTLLHDLTCIVKQLKQGSEIFVQSEDTNVIKVAEQIKSVLGGGIGEALTRFDVLHFFKSRTFAFNAPVRLCFITICEAIKADAQMPEQAILQGFMRNAIFLNKNGFVPELWNYMEVLVEIVVEKLKQSFSANNREIKHNLSEFLITLGFTGKTACLIITKLEKLFESYIFYVQTVNKSVVIEKDDEVEMLFLLLNTLIRIFEQNSCQLEMCNRQQFKKLFKTLTTFKSLFNNLIFCNETDYCLGLIPL